MTTMTRWFGCCLLGTSVALHAASSLQVGVESADGARALAQSRFPRVSPAASKSEDELACPADESLAGAPAGVERTSPLELRIRWRGGTRIFRDSGLPTGELDGQHYRYCGFDAVSQTHLVHKHDGDIFGGILLDHVTGRLLPAGQRVIFSRPDGRYFATVQPNGLDGEEWSIRSRAGALLWKGLSGITVTHPRDKVESVIATLDEPRWSSMGELQALAKCVKGDPNPTWLSLRRVGRGFRWEPKLSCEH